MALTCGRQVAAVHQVYFYSVRLDAGHLVTHGAGRRVLDHSAAAKNIRSKSREKIPWRGDAGASSRLLVSKLISYNGSAALDLRHEGVANVGNSRQ